MTSEIAVMNKNAVALAADSAVTIEEFNSNREHKRKIWNTSNKLFHLSKFAPVGIMIYGSAEIMDVPWETVIKNYRESLGEKKFDHLEEYGLDFFNNIKNSFSEEEQGIFFFSNLGSFLYYIRGLILKDVKEITDTKEISYQEIKNIIEKQITSVWENFRKKENLKNIPENFQKSFIEKYEEKINEGIKDIFEELPISKKQKQRIYDLAYYIFTKDYFSDFCSGIVISGFGEKDNFPGAMNYVANGVLLGFFKYNLIDDHKLTHRNSASILAFAQKDVAQTFISGMSESYDDMFSGYLSHLLDEFPEAIVDSLNGISATQKASILGTIKNDSEKRLENFHNELDNFKHERFIDPLVHAVDFLPKDELATLAEALVNLTSLKRKMSFDGETVGGPIDVAVISKGDGFVWIKRKYYFPPEINHHYFSNYFRGEKQ
jgi:hypothetical protein